MQRLVSRRPVSHLLLVGFAMVLVAARDSGAHAAIVPDFQYNAAQTFFAANVSSTDLINGLAGTYVGFMSGGPNINDGLHGGDSDFASLAWAADSGTTSTWDLGVGPTGLGWDITSVRSIAAWDSAEFHEQAYNIYIKKVGEVSFTLFTNVNYQPGGGSGSTQVLLTEDLTGILASKVKEIQFQFLDVSASSGSTTYRELDIEGIATPIIPEPATLTLLGLGAIGLTIKARRRRRAD